MTPDANHALLRRAALIAVPTGAVGSIVFMFIVGHRNQSRILMALFTIWVLSPFVAQGWAFATSNRWSVRAQTLLHRLTLVIALASLALYGNVALGPPRAQPAFWFLIVPFTSWLLFALVVATAVLKNKGTPTPEPGPPRTRD